MKKISWRLWGIIVLIGIIFLASGCDPAGTASDGKVTVSLTNHGGGEDTHLYAYLYASSETDTSESKVLACNLEAIGADNTASFILEEEDASTADNWAPNGTQWIGSGGNSYDLYIYTADIGNDPVTAGTADDKKIVPFPMSVTIDGDQTVEIDYTDMVAY